MKIVCLSDTHSQHYYFTEKLPRSGDIIIHAGDLTRVGSVAGIQDFIDWFTELPYKYKIFIAGNHDFALQKEKSQIHFPENIIYLEHNRVVIEGIKIWGSPAIDCFGWAFDKTDVERDDIYYTIPRDCDIIVSHVPPYGIMDKRSMINQHVGCKILKRRIEEIKPKLVIFGHVHEAAGIFVDNDTTYINTACNINLFDYNHNKML
ncbi:MAG: metallophosphatase domain-containing protein [Burkholderiales bacterium]|nr:metallophosphatase domain-containing protein [Burkholderiales bacterium]